MLARYVKVKWQMFSNPFKNINNPQLENMSVIPPPQRPLHFEYTQTRNHIVSTLSTYQSDLLLYHSQISTALQQLTHSHLKQTLEQQKFIEELQRQLQQSRSVKNKLEIEIVKKDQIFDELKGEYDLLKDQHEFKVMKIEELNEEIQQIRHYIVEMQESKLRKEQEQEQAHGQEDQQQNKNVVNFDDSSNEGNNQNGQQRFNDLQTINEVSEYDMSVSASMSSLSSCFTEGLDGKMENCGSQPITNCTIEPKAVQNYQDALQFLKNYNNNNNNSPQPRPNPTQKEDINPNPIKQQKQSQTILPVQNQNSTNQAPTTMPRKNKLSITTLSKQNIPATNTENRPYKNDTIAKIKKMRRIQSLELESGYVVKSDKKNSHENIVNVSIEQISPLILQEKDSNNHLQKNSRESLPPSARSHASSQIISLQQPIQHLHSILDHINSSCQKHIQIQISNPSICKITYQNQLSYQGSCDQHHIPQGFGKLMKNTEVLYQGEWRKGKFHGWGKLVLLPFLASPHAKQIVQIDGNFRNGALEGTCVCLFSSGQKFMGSIRQGHIENQGTFVSEQGIMTGHWENSNLVLLI